jgi:hypothetical protein
MWLPVVLVLLAVGCLGSVGYSLYRLTRSDRTPIPFAEPTGQAASRASAGTSISAPSSGAAAATGNASASDYPVSKAEDLMRVCDRWYYPQSPTLAGPAPHPIGVVVKGRFDMPSRLNKSFYDYPSFELKEPAKAQLVACVDLVEAGQDVRTCKFDDPKPDSLPLKEGVYQLTLYEVATRRTILEKRVIGAGECPYVTLVGADRTLFTDVTERQLYETLRQYVEH